MSPRSHRHRRRPFTLLEILVTIGIMAVVASMLLPSAARARSKGKQLRCLNGSKQLAMALSMYADDNSGYFPVEEWVAGDTPETYWTQKTKEYFGDKAPNTEPIDFLACPGMPVVSNCMVDANNESNYMANDLIVRYGGGNWSALPYESVKPDQVVSSSKTALSVCGSSLASTNSGLSASDKALLSRCGTVTQVSDQTLRFPHLDQFENCNVMYVDSHVESMRLENVPTSISDVFWDPTK